MLLIFINTIVIFLKYLAQKDMRFRIEKASKHTTQKMKMVPSTIMFQTKSKLPT